MRKDTISFALEIKKSEARCLFHFNLSPNSPNKPFFKSLSCTLGIEQPR